MLYTVKHAIDTELLYFRRAIIHDLAANGIRVSFLSN